mmetsp:Transcript_94087/g.172433  ORF Transcript_94087/g.172433 Transcript_94087/m.172433 type:complete len:205 (+) Transcript_94087:1299-1913(+)
MYKTIEWTPGQTFCNTSCNDTTEDKRIHEGMVRDEHAELLPCLGLAGLCVLVDFILQALHIRSKLCIIHGMPAFAGVGAGTFADRNVMLQLENSVGRIISGLCLILAGIHGKTAHALQGIVSIVMSLMENARAWGKLKAASILLCSLPVVCTKLKDHHAVTIDFRDDLLQVNSIFGRFTGNSWWLRRLCNTVRSVRLTRGAAHC